MREFLLFEENFNKLKGLKETDGLTLENVQYGNMFVGDIERFVYLEKVGKDKFIKHNIECEITALQKLSESSIWIKVKKLKEFKN